MNNNYPSSKSSDQNQKSTEHEEVLQDPITMKIKDIQWELKNRGISYGDCFDRTSLVQRLVEARQQKPSSSSVHESKSTPRTNDVLPTENSSDTTTSTFPTTQDHEILIRLRSMSVKELRTECSKYNIRWGQMIEKDDLIQALLQHYRNRANQVFSLTGKIIPGQVADISDEILKQELQPGKNVPPLLLDVRPSILFFLCMMLSVLKAFLSHSLVCVCVFYFHYKTEIQYSNVSLCLFRCMLHGVVHVKSWLHN